MYVITNIGFFLILLQNFLLSLYCVSLNLLFFLQSILPIPLVPHFNVRLSLPEVPDIFKLVKLVNRIKCRKTERRIKKGLAYTLHQWITQPYSRTVWNRWIDTWVHPKGVMVRFEGWGPPRYRSNSIVHWRHDCITKWHTYPGEERYVTV